MIQHEISQRLQKIIGEVFEIEKPKLPNNLNQNSIEQWDSLGHLRLIMAVESEFHIRFPVKSIPELTSFKALETEIINASQ